jgi:hypothetical protein
VVTGRVCGDDEDSALIVEAEGVEDAEAAFIEQLFNCTRLHDEYPSFAAWDELDEKDDDAIFVNYVIECPGGEPRVLSSAP